MRSDKNLLILTLFLLGLGAVSAFAQTASEDPSQLGSRQLEVRTLDVNYDVAYRSATQALLGLGYGINHSDKTSGILSGSRSVGVTEMKQQVRQSKEEMKGYQDQVQKETVARSALGFVPYVGRLAWLIPGSQPPEQKEIKEASSYQITMLLQSMGNKETQIRFKMQKDGEPVWDQVTIDRLWVTTQREAMIESGPPPAATSSQPASVPEQKVKKEPTKK